RRAALARRGGLGLPLRARLPCRHPPRGGPAQGARRAHGLQPARPAHQPRAAGGAGGGRAPAGADGLPRALPGAARREAGVGGARLRPGRAFALRADDGRRLRRGRRGGAHVHGDAGGRGPGPLRRRVAARRRCRGQRDDRERGARRRAGTEAGRGRAQRRGGAGGGRPGGEPEGRRGAGRAGHRRGPGFAPARARAGAVALMNGGSDVLARILARTRECVQERRRKLPVDKMRFTGATPGLRRSFEAAVSRPGQVNVIAEFKRRSPSRGVIREDLHPVKAAQAYEVAGAAALSVLTEEQFFGGSLEDLKEARGATLLPTLRKDFIVDPYQVWETWHAGADALLLIVAALDDGALRDLLAAGREVALPALVEVHAQGELERAVRGGG